MVQAKLPCHPAPQDPVKMELLVYPSLPHLCAHVVQGILDFYAKIKLITVLIPHVLMEVRVQAKLVVLLVNVQVNILETGVKMR